MSRGGGAALERELKFATADLESTRQVLVEQCAQLVTPRGLEENWVYDHDHELRSQGRLLRLRRDVHGSRLTYKGPATFERGLKTRTEREVGLASGSETLAETQAVLEALGYGLVCRYHKVREEWRLGTTIVALDRTPIGEFVEFEGDEASSAAEACGFALDRAESRSYLELYEDYRREHSDAPADMVFAQDALEGYGLDG